jgi:ribosomal-protein-serine acetyltransferase
MRSVMVDFPLPIVTPRLLMRQPILGYVDAYEYTTTVMESMKEFQQWLPWAQYYPTVDQSEEYIRECCASWIMKNNNNVGLPLWIIERSTNTLAGSIVMHNIAWNVPKFEFGYWLRTSHTGKGYMAEATNALTRYCFQQIGAKRIEIRSEIANARSQKIPKRLGFNYDGILRHNEISVASGQVTDSVVYSRINLDGLPELDVKWGPDAAK